MSIDIENKFIFTEEGRKLIISQEGGVKFSILGAVLVQGLKPTNDLLEEYNKLTLEKLFNNKSVIVGFNNVEYKTVSTTESQANSQKVIPFNEQEYKNLINNFTNNSLDNIISYLYPLKYIPTLEFNDDVQNYYGTYELDFSTTSFNYDWKNDISFAHIVLIGKQYAETPNYFSVAETQKPSIVAIGQVYGSYDEDVDRFTGGIQFFAKQNNYVSYKLKIHFTLTDTAEDITSKIELNPEYNDVKRLSDKLNIINDGIKTNTRINILGDNPIDKTEDGRSINDDLQLDDQGSVAVTRSVMINDNNTNSILYEEQLNAAGLLHIVNKNDSDSVYKKQLLLTTVEQPTEFAKEATAYSVTMHLNSFEAYIDAQELTSSGASASGYPSPKFSLNSIPSNEEISVDLFGSENYYLQYDKTLEIRNTDKSIFSKNNVTTEPKYDGNNIFIDSNYNIGFSAANLDNLLIKSDSNVLSSSSNTNLLLGVSNSIIASTESVAINADGCVIRGKNKAIFNGKNIDTPRDTSNTVYLGKYNTTSLYNSPVLIFGNGSSLERSNVIEVYNDRIIMPSGKHVTTIMPNYISFDNNTVYTNNKIVLNNKTELNNNNLYINNGSKHVSLAPSGLVFSNNAGNKSCISANETNGVDIYDNVQIKSNNDTSYVSLKNDSICIYNNKFSNPSVKIDNNNGAGQVSASTILGTVGKFRTLNGQNIQADSITTKNLVVTNKGYSESKVLNAYISYQYTVDSNGDAINNVSCYQYINGTALTNTDFAGLPQQIQFIALNNILIPSFGGDFTPDAGKNSQNYTKNILAYTSIEQFRTISIYDRFNNSTQAETCAKVGWYPSTIGGDDKYCIFYIPDIYPNMMPDTMDYSEVNIFITLLNNWDLNKYWYLPWSPVFSKNCQYNGCTFNLYLHYLHDSSNSKATFIFNTPDPVGAELNAHVVKTELKKGESLHLNTNGTCAGGGATYSFDNYACGYPSWAHAPYTTWHKF